MAVSKSTKESTEKTKSDKPKIIKVKSGRDDNRVVLWEKHPNHPGKEVYVADGSGNAKPVSVAETPKVLQALAQGKLVKV